ncbi:MAG TPA: HAMP domain-containing sensor histidine kinase [Candidatus Acidoferrum sp.]|nr:HAMP domain-containing sensor histidine kinase [Candidatus Acidoferrum sp.]
MRAKTLRSRMMMLFCSVVGVLLAASYLAFWALLAHAIPAQLNRQLVETSRPIIADVASEPNARDVERLDIPGQFFELLDASGKVLQRSKNLANSIDLKGLKLNGSQAVFGVGAVGESESVRVALIPFEQAAGRRFLAIAIPTFGTNRLLDTFGGITLLLFPLSLLLTAAISAFYVGKSLTPVKALTRHAELMAKRVTDHQGFWSPLPVASPDDELGRLAETFNRLLQSVDSAVHQLRQFATDASHELRTPLAILHGETELILSKPRTAEEYRKTLAAIDDELKKLTRIVEGLFTLSMADAGQLRLESEPVYVNEILEEACALVGSRARTKNISIMRDLNREVAYVGDEAFLHELFLIFLDNAIKYSSPDTRVHVTLAQTGGMIQIRFEDHGIGIAKEHLPFIFERFYRAARPGNGELHSGGLGLAIAQAIARAQGGSITCESTPGAGSTFTILLPTLQSAEMCPKDSPEQKLILH